MASVLPDNVIVCAVHGRQFLAGGVCADCVSPPGLIKFVVGRSFDSLSQRERKRQATEMVNRSLGEGRLLVGHDPGFEAQRLACTEPVESPEALCKRLSDEASAIMGTPMRVSVERVPETRTHWLMMCCESCRLMWESFIDDHAMVNGWERENLRALIDHALERRFCSCVDGLTVAECLERYQAFQRNERRSIVPLLTDRQLEAARTAWSSALRAKQQEQRAKERHQVVCERDEDGE